MKHILSAIVAVVITSVASCGKATPPQPQPSGLASRVASGVPEGWSLEESNGQILISRRKPVRAHGCVGLDASWAIHPEELREFVEKSGIDLAYKIRLRRGAKIDLAEYANLARSNSQINVTKWTIIPNREFFEAHAMQSFDPRYRQLPDYYDNDSSFYLETTMHPWECIYPGEIAREVEGVLNALDSLFSKYPEAYPGSNSRRTLSWMGG